MLTVIAWISIGVALVCATWIAIDEVRHPQAMTIMNFVWPLTALYFSIFALWAYYTLGRQKTKQAMSAQSDTMPHEGTTPKHITVAQVAIATSHCGAGCALADLISEFGIAAAGLTLFGLTLWADYVIDFAAAWALGIVFQYFSIKPMRKLSAGAVILAGI